MKPDILERLMMDRALGRLDPDAEVLLADYLANDPAAATQARELQEIVRLATKVLQHPAPVVEMPTQINQLVWRHRTERLLALAASFVIGVGLTALLIHGTSSTRKMSLLRIRQQLQKSNRPLVKNQIESLPFWSNQRIYLLASAANSKENVQ